MTYTITYKNELYHHGILGQKWGVRRFRNNDGTLTREGKERYASGKVDKTKSSITGKKIAAITAGATIAAASAYAAVHPEIVRSITNSAAMKAAMPQAKAALNTKKALNAIGESAKSGFKKGMESGTEKIVTAAVAGSIMLVGKKALDRMLGQDTAGKVMNANNKKKIGSYWNYVDPSSRYSDDDDD